MPQIPLFTSIPAHVRRLVHGTQEVGPAWTRACIASWQRAGYRVVSVNAASEAQQVRAQHPGIEVVEVARDGSASTGRPLVYVSDMLALMARCGHSSVAVANADVMCMTGAIERLRSWQPDGFAYGSRLDIDDPQGANPRLHGGMDYLIVNTRHLQALPAPDFLFGTPWWDYWLPMALMGRGVPGARLSVNGLPVIAHLAHPERWDSADFTRNFALFATALADAARGGSAPDALLGMCMDIARATSAALHPLNPGVDLAGTTTMADAA